MLDDHLMLHTDPGQRQVNVSEIQQLNRWNGRFLRLGTSLQFCAVADDLINSSLVKSFASEVGFGGEFVKRDPHARPTRAATQRAGASAEKPLPLSIENRQKVGPCFGPGQRSVFNHSLSNSLCLSRPPDSQHLVSELR